MEVKVPIPESELTVGRDQCCDVVLHSMAVSRRHVGFKCVSEGLRVRNLGAKNLATMGGREVQDFCILGRSTSAALSLPLSHLMSRDLPGHEKGVVHFWIHPPAAGKRSECLIGLSYIGIAVVWT